MVVMSANGISKSYGIEGILEDVSFSVSKKDRIGIVGPNGAGKTTLLNIMAGELEPSGGSVYIRSDCSVGYLKQKNNIRGNGTVIEEAERIFSDLFSMETEIKRLHEAISDSSNPEFDADLHAYSELMDKYEAAGGYSYKSELKAVLRHMGFSDEDQRKTVDVLSGGERTRLALSCMLLEKPDIMLLDEPTNHLDLSMLAWLENYLKNYDGTLLVVSHDRYFLDKLVTKIYDVNGGGLDEYRGNYSEYVVKKAERLEVKQREYEKQQKEIEKQEEIIRRFKQHNTEHLVKRAQSREKRLEHMERLEKPKLKQAKLKLEFDRNFKSGNDVIIAEDLSKSWGDNHLFSGVNLDIKSGEKISIIGDNGRGKTTLLKILIGQEKADEGYLKIGYNVEFGYYDQGQRLLDDYETVLGEMKNTYHLYTDTEMRSLLGRFLFRGDDVFKKVGSLSGGEKAKLSLLKLMLSGANTIVLDEPTNHLDIDSKEVVEEALEEFEGTVIIVSHDRYMLSRIPDRILELTEGGIVEYKGKFDYYTEKKAQEEREEAERDRIYAAEAAKPVSAADDRQARKQQEAEARRLSRRKEELESRINEQEIAIAELEHEMCNPERTSDVAFMNEAGERLKKLRDELEQTYEEWMELEQ